MASTYGLDPNLISSSTLAGVYQPETSGFFGRLNEGRWLQEPKTTQTYNGPGGTYTSDPSGSWKSSTGQLVGDLPGYLKMKGQQQTGADFSGYQNQLQGLLNDPSKIQQTAGYQFAVDQGNQAINRSAAAKGQLNSGGVLAELAKYGQGMASQDYGNQVNRLTGLMQGAQQFGVQSGYYQAPQSIATAAPRSASEGTIYYKPSNW